MTSIHPPMVEGGIRGNTKFYRFSNSIFLVRLRNPISSGQMEEETGYVRRQIVALRVMIAVIVLCGIVPVVVRLGGSGPSMERATLTKDFGGQRLRTSIGARLSAFRVYSGNVQHNVKLLHDFIRSIRNVHALEYCRNTLSDGILLFHDRRHRICSVSRNAKKKYAVDGRAPYAVGELLLRIHSIYNGGSSAHEACFPRVYCCRRYCWHDCSCCAVRHR